MAAATLTDIPLDEIETRAASMRPGRTALAVVGWVLYQLGFVAGLFMTKVFWGSFKFTVAALVTGYQAASGPSKRQQIARLQRENFDLRTQVSRIVGPS